jgi:hypothetical protein
MEWDPSMSNDCDAARSVAASAALSAAREVWRTMNFLPQTTASTLIDFLKEAPYKMNAETANGRKSVQKDNGEIEGMHKVGDRIFKVQRAVHGSGHLYAKELVMDPNESDAAEPTFSFQYAAGAIRLLSQETLLSLEDAKAFGALYGVCCVCAATLTDEKSIEAGIGPVCGKRF